MSKDSASESTSKLSDTEKVEKESLKTDEEPLLEVKVQKNESKYRGFRAKLQQRMRQRFFRRQKMGEEKIVETSSSVNKLINKEKKDREKYEEQERKRKLQERKKRQLEKLRQKKLEQEKNKLENAGKKQDDENNPSVIPPPLPLLPPVPPSMEQSQDDDIMSSYNPNDYEFKVQIIRAAWYIRLMHQFQLFYRFLISICVNFIEFIGKLIRTAVLYMRGIQCYVLVGGL